MNGRRVTVTTVLAARVIAPTTTVPTKRLDPKVHHNKFLSCSLVFPQISEKKRKLKTLPNIVPSAVSKTSLFTAAICEKISGDPFPRAKNVTP
jgi:hypothetical protein